MFYIALGIGVYSYLIFLLGVVGLLALPFIICMTFIYVIVVLYLSKRQIPKTFYVLKKELSRFGILEIFFTVLIILQVIVNSIGVFIPETGFDALWYHLTLPKLYLYYHAIPVISGSLLHYSGMPQLTEMLYTVALALQGETLAKLFNFAFGVFTIFVIYRLSKKYTTSLIGLLTACIFYANLVVGWESMSAYNDLTRAFFEVTAFLAFMEWVEKRKYIYLFLSAVLVGFAICTKVLSIGSIGIYLVIITFIGLYSKVHLQSLLKSYAVFIITALFVPMPWFIRAYMATGNPLYPLFSPTLSHLNDKVFTLQLLNPSRFFETIIGVFISASDPISPLYIIFVPLIIFAIQRSTLQYKITCVYVVLSLVFWYMTAQLEGSRMLLPYLPVFSYLLGLTIFRYWKNVPIRNLILLVVVVTSGISIFYRGVANSRYFSVISGKESRSEYIAGNLNFSFGDFYDIDNFFKDTIHGEDRVLLFGFHNLYYIDFPFIHSSFVKKGDKFNYIATQRTQLPLRFRGWERVYENMTTGVKLYTDHKKMYVY